MLQKGVFMGEIKQQKIKQHQIFDNAFLSGCAWHKRLLIPLINEVFNKNIPEDAVIEGLSNEHFKQGLDDENDDRLIKRITDALIKANGERYHFECESKNDGEILIRIAEYDTQIAINDAKYEEYSVIVNLPQTAVIFLRNHRNIPKEGIIYYSNGNQVLSHKIPFLKVGNYSLEYLSENHLYILFPFYLMRYEHAIKNTPSKYDLIEKEFQRVYDYIINAYDDGRLTQKECANIAVLCIDVANEISRNTDIHERLVNTMGYEILLTAEERGEVKMAIHNIKNAMEAFSLSFDEVCDKLKLENKERYRKYMDVY